MLDKLKPLIQELAEVEYKISNTLDNIDREDQEVYKFTLKQVEGLCGRLLELREGIINSVLEIYGGKNDQ